MKAYVTCARCNRYRQHQGRCLCSGCYSYVKDNGLFADYPRPTHSRKEVLEELEFLSEEFLTLDQIAPRLGMKPKTLKRAVHRAGLSIRDGRAVLAA